jgi:hypothetical protein
MKRIVLFSLINYVCNIISALCIWDGVPCHENYSLNSCVFSWCVIVLNPFLLGTWTRGLCTSPKYQVRVCYSGHIYIYFCVFCKVIYLCCSFSSFVLVTLTASQQYPNEWGSTAQKPGENLMCGPSVMSTRQNSPLLRQGNPGGSLSYLVFVSVI